MSDYVKKITHSSTFHEGQTIHADNATLSSTYSSTLTEKDLELTQNASITSDHSATIIIDKLVCIDASIKVTYSSTVHIKELDMSGTCEIDVDYTSTLIIDGGNINIIGGTVKRASTGKCKAKLKADNVTPDWTSRWDT